MDKKVYEDTFNTEDNYWWFVGLRKLIFPFIDKFGDKRGSLQFLDAGCGTGSMLERYNKYCTYGLDFSEEAIRFCKIRNLNNLLRGSICEFPFKNNMFDIVVSMDVLCQVDVENSLETLKEFHRIIKMEGIILLNLPAYDFLKSKHDKIAHVKHRYTLNELKEKLEKAGFEIERISYRVTILFPIIFIKRMIDKIFFMNKVDIESDLKPLPDPVNKFFTGVLSVENMLIKSGVNFPFGLSLFCVARKKK